MGTNRLESFSDGVIAVAITLLVLALVPPSLKDASEHSLIYELGRNWSHYVAYVISFMTIGIIWINHHAMITRLNDADHSILILNLILLMTIGILPFATDLMATYLPAHHGQKLAAGVYGGAFLVMSVAFSVLNRHILLARAHMLSVEIPLEQRRRILSRSISGLAPYLIATILAVVSAYATLAICAALAVFYALPIASGGTMRSQ
jgi:TMEM175 potassium channel family protein